MPSPKKPRAATKPSRPAADATCTLSRTVKRGRRRFEVWSCSDPEQGQPTEEQARVKFAPVIERIGGRNWRFWYVSQQDYELDEGEGWGCTPGWWFKAVNANPAWVSNDPVGPYATLEEAIEDVQVTINAGGC